MNVFILNTGRCGSTTFIKACQHITNFSSAHESRLSKIGEQRLAYPRCHIEADNRLCWYTGRLDKIYGDDAYYVHLTRNTNDVINSFSKRLDFGIMKAYEQGILMHDGHGYSAEELASDYIDTVENNINFFLKDKSNKMGVAIESIETDFHQFWNNISAEGDFDAALKEWDINYNAS